MFAAKLETWPQAGWWQSDYGIRRSDENLSQMLESQYAQDPTIHLPAGRDGNALCDPHAGARKLSDPSRFAAQRRVCPQGKVTSHRFTDSKIYPGTERDYFIYVPAQYDGSKPAALMVFQDGKNYVNDKGQWRVPTVLDNLIHSGEMPVTIGVFVNPGVVSGGEGAPRSFQSQLRVRHGE